MRKFKTKCPRCLRVIVFYSSRRVATINIHCSHCGAQYDLPVYETKDIHHDSRQDAK